MVPLPPSQDRREEIKRAFNADPKKHPLRIVLAADGPREGINLQTNECEVSPTEGVGHANRVLERLLGACPGQLARWSESSASDSAGAARKSRTACS
jgi:hypothetical protein